MKETIPKWLDGATLGRREARLGIYLGPTARDLYYQIRILF